MNFAPLAALGLALAAITAPAVVTAQTTAPADALTIDTPIETLMADERSKAVVTKHLPGIDQHPAYEDFKALSLKSLAPFSQGMITAELLEKIAAELATIQ
jgi:hypothetical protein